MSNRTFEKAINFISKKNYEQATKYIEEILSTDSNSIEGLNLIIFIKVQTKKFDEAEVYMKRLINVDPKNISNKFNYGKLLLDNGKFDKSLIENFEILNDYPTHVNALNNISYCYYQLKKYDDANYYVKKAIEYSTDGNLNLYKLYLKIQEFIKNFDEVKNYLNAINCKYDTCEIKNVFIEFYINTKNYNEANALLDDLLTSSFINPYTLFLKGLNEYSQKNFENALIFFNNSLKLNSKNIYIHYNIGCTLLQLNKYDEASKIFKNILEKSPEYKDAWINYGVTLHRQAKFSDALICFNKAIFLDDKSAEAWSNKGNLLFDLEKYEQAEECYLSAKNFDSSYYQGIYNHSLLLLATKDFLTGWKSFKYRWQWGGFSSTPIETSKPEWSGTPSNKRLFIWGEQGIGDQILYASMFSDLQSFPQEKIISVNKKLLPIFTRSFINLSFIEKDNLFPEERYDEHLPLGDLGGVLRPDIASFDSVHFPYLLHDVARTDKIREQLPNNGNLICGISWKSLNQDIGDYKSMALTELMPLLQKDGIDFINLQYGDTAQELQELRANNVHLYEVDGVDLFEDVDGVLSIIQACNIIITVSNTTAHLAGALGKRTYLLLPKGRGRLWYWHQSENGNLWYPSIKVIEQDKPGDWNSAMQKLMVEIRK